MNKSTEKVSDFVKTSSIGSKNEHRTSGLYIPPEGTEEFEKWMAALDQMMDEVEEHNSKCARK